MPDIFSIRQFYWIVMIFAFFITRQQYAQVRVSGRVLDQENDRPIGSATILIEGENSVSNTDSNGVFSLLAQKSSHLVLHVSCVGYKTTHQSIIPRGNDSPGVIIHLSPSILQTGTVIITGDHTHDDHDVLTGYSKVLTGKNLARELGNTLAATLKSETGISLRSMGPAPARPVIRGLSGDRIQILEDGFATNDLSATSPDHAVAIESMNTERVEVVRGPKVLLSNASSLGGIVNVIKNEIPQSTLSHIDGSIGLFAETSSKAFAENINVQIPWQAITANLDGTFRKTGDLTTPKGLVKNSAIETSTYSTGVSYINHQLLIGAGYKEYNSDYGVPGGFVGAHPNGVDITMFKRDVSFLAKIPLDLENFKNLTIKVNRNYYRHQEFESAGVIGAEFTIYDVSPVVSLETKNFGVFDAGEFSAGYEYRDFNIGGFVFSPPVVSKKYSLAGYQKRDFGDSRIELALRAENAELNPQKIDRNTKPEYEKMRSFFTFSGAISYFHQITERISGGIVFSRYSRMPTIEELYSEGPHLAAYSYEIGNPNLKAEFGNAFELNMAYNEETVKHSLNLYYYVIPYYIIPRNSGRINYATLLPIYKTDGVSAHLSGFEHTTEVDAGYGMKLSLHNSYTIGQFAKSSKPLPGIAPFKSVLEFHLKREYFQYGIKCEFIASQNKVDVFEQPTSGYFLMGTSIQSSFSAWETVQSISLMIDNVFNRDYRNHLSRIKSILPEAGREARLLYKVYF